MVDDFVDNFPLDLWEKNLSSLQKSNFSKIVFIIEDVNNCLTKQNLWELAAILKSKQKLEKLHISFGSFNINLENGSKGN